MIEFINVTHHKKIMLFNYMLHFNLYIKKEDTIENNDFNLFIKNNIK